MEIGVTLLAKYPSIQDIIYNELTNNGVNKDDAFDLSKVNRFSQFRAFIYEALRLAAPVPDGVQRYCDKEIRVVWYNEGGNNNNNNNTDSSSDII